MQRFIGLLLALPVVLADNNVFGSVWTLLGVCVFTSVIGGILAYACMMDMKHWRKSIDARAQLEYPTASALEFQLPPIQKTSEKTDIVTKSPVDVETRRHDLTLEKTQDDKTLRIVRAMYTSSNRDVPPLVQQSLQSKCNTPNRSMTHSKPPTVLNTISERSNEGDDKSSEQSRFVLKKKMP